MDGITFEEDDALTRGRIYVLENKLKTAAFLVSSIGAFFVASMDYGVQVLGFELWIVSNIAWMSIGVKESDYPLLMTFFVYFVFNMLGTAKRWGWC